MICIRTSVSPTRTPHHQFNNKKNVVTNLRATRLVIDMESAMKPAATFAAASSSSSQPLILTSGASGRATVLFSLRALRSLLLLFNSFLLLLLLPFRWRMIEVSERLENSERSEEEKSERSEVVRVPAAMVKRAREGEAATRRAMAIRRLGTEEEEDGKQRTKREFCIFSSPRGDTLFTQSWTPLAVQTKLTYLEWTLLGGWTPGHLTTCVQRRTCSPHTNLLLIRSQWRTNLKLKFWRPD